MKVIGWLTKTVLMTIVICTCSILTTWVVVQSYADRLLHSFGVQLGEGSSIPLGEMLANLSGVLHMMNQGNAGDAAGSGGADTPAGQDAASSSPDSGTGAGPASGTDSTSGTDGPAAGGSGADPSVPVFGQSAGADQSNSSQLLLSAQDIYNKKEKISNEDKLTIFSILSKLPTEDMQRISADLEDGVTADELREIEQIVQKNISKEEYQRLIQILNKY